MTFPSRHAASSSTASDSPSPTESSTITALPSPSCELPTRGSRSGTPAGCAPCWGRELMAAKAFPKGQSGVVDEVEEAPVAGGGGGSRGGEGRGEREV